MAAFGILGILGFVFSIAALGQIWQLRAEIADLRARIESGK